MTYSNKDVQASIHFLNPSEIFATEKPYAFRFGLNTKDISQSNFDMKPVGNIIIKDIRDCINNWSLEKNGFFILDSKSRLQYEDYYDTEKLKIYFSELEDLLKENLGAYHVLVFRHGLRKRHPDFPVSIGERYDYDQPTSVAHVDTTPDEMIEEIKRQNLGSLLDNSRRVQWINIWKPLRGPLNDWPLTVCDASMVNEEIDLEAADLLYPDLATENFQVYHNKNYRWYYLSDHAPSELMVFKQADSLVGSCPGVPHCSFFNPLAPTEEPPRESIEARALVFY